MKRIENFSEKNTKTTTINSLSKTDTPKSQRIRKGLVHNKNNGIIDNNLMKKKRRHGHGNHTGKHRHRHIRDNSKGI